MGPTQLIVLDTSALLYWTLEPARLTKPAADALESHEQILVSSISLWEIALKHHKGRLNLGFPPRELQARLERVEGVVILDVDSETWMTSVELNWIHADPADRVIVATAMQRDCRLLTSDSQILSFYAKAFFSGR